ncbi:MAG: apolipoprotein N-acyltransferase [Spirochaetales bacterium]|nr:apolipoprotein N-acyltransferase [Spirochaetales bacterium]
MGWTYVAVFLIETLLVFVGPARVPLDNLVSGDAVYGLLLLAHLGVGLAALARGGARPRAARLRLHAPELLFLVVLLFFLFSYIYALNANMDYVQRFIASGGAVRLAIDTRRERLAAVLRYLPLLAVNLGFYLLPRLRRGEGGLLPRELGSDHGELALPVDRWALPLTLLSVALGVLAFPSFVRLEGLGFLAFVALVPLFLVLLGSPPARGLLHGTAYGVLQGMLLNYWLGTYSLVSLQLVSLVTLAYHVPFLLVILWLARRLPRAGALILAAGWTGFEYLRSIGFLGYPWGLWGTTQIQFPTLIQIAALTGVWGVSFVVLFLNAGVAGGIAGWIGRGTGGVRGGVGGTGSRWPAGRAFAGLPGLRGGRCGGLLAASAVFLGVVVFGTVSMAIRENLPVDKTVRLALVQQNDDPRKHDYQDTFDTLVRLTDQAMLQSPDLVVWSETAFVPNIRRWSQMDPERYPLAKLVRRFLEYQRGLGIWLITGNDDYELTVDEEGDPVRLDFNAAILFDPQGTRVATYHKMRLVPFTEYFPWKRQLPRVHRWLEERDVYLWEPGGERTVFRHPKLDFSTPICFEDAFPSDVRLFVAAGAEAVVNLSNDFWSLTEVEGRQHAVNAAFRAVENRRPLVRATASGLTCYVDTEGRFRASLPYYREGVLVVDVEIPATRRALTPYTRLGDWFPITALALLGLLAGLSLFPSVRRRR